MKHISSYLIFFLTLAVPSLYGQIACTTPSPSRVQVKATERQILELKKRRTGGRIAASGIQYVPLKIHILRKTNGTSGVSAARMGEFLGELNRRMANPAGNASIIQFYLCSGVDYINNDAYYNNNTQIFTVHANYGVRNAVNLYFFYTTGTSVAQSQFPTTAQNSNWIYVLSSTTDMLPSAKTVQHESGHYFNLYHTFESATFGKELVNRTNCTTAGDLLCDTPADPFAYGSTSCVYSGTATDANGQTYQPDVTNIMSYYNCAANFTNGQYQRMFDGLAIRQTPNADTASRYTLDGPGDLVSAPSALTVVNTPIIRSVKLAWTDNSANEMGFMIERSANTTDNFVGVGGVGPNMTTFTDTASIQANTTYYYRVKPSNTRNAAYSNVFTTTTGVLYCTPVHFPTPLFSINSVTLKSGGTTLLSNQNTGIATNLYADYTGSLTPPMLTPGQSYSITVQGIFNNSLSGTFAAWIDYNRNGTFDSSERLFESSALSAQSTSYSAVFTVPANATISPTVLRIRSNTGGNVDPCKNPTAGISDIGETEDYAVVIQSAIPAPTISTGQPGNSCAGSTVAVAFSTMGSFNAGDVFTVQLLTDSNQLINTNIGSGISSPITAIIPAATAAGNYKVRVVPSSPSVTGSASSAFTINTAPSASISGTQTITAGQAATLSVNLSGTAPWSFTLSDGQTFSNVNTSSFSVAVSPTATTTYSIAKVGNACGTAVGTGSTVVTALPPCTAPSASLSGSQTITAGQSVTLSVSLSGTAPWSLTLSDGQTFSNLSTPTLNVPVSPTATTATTTYSVIKVSNTCGNAIGTGSATITVNTGGNCPTTLTQTGSVASGTQNVQASQSITSTASVYNGASVNYSAGASIILQTGFRASAGAYFRAYLGGCSAMARVAAEDLVDDLGAYPNPASNEVTIRYRLALDGRAGLYLINSNGQPLKTLVEERDHKAGTYTEKVNVSELPDGLYLYVLRGAQVYQIKKLIVQK